MRTKFKVLELIIFAECKKMLDSLFNFRALGGPLFNEMTNEADPNKFNPLKINVYRCARPDNIGVEDLNYLQSNLGVK